MADVVIFPEQTLEFSVEGGVAQRVLIPAPFELIIGETYRVALDGVAHVATCVHVDGAPAITNIADPSNPDLPEDGSFLIGYLPPEIAEADGNSVAMVMCIDRSNAPTHTLAIYQTAAVSNDVITENWDGSTEVHPGVESVSLETEDGGEKEFILKDLVAEPVEKTVELDFSGGDMIVTPKKGQAFSSILIPKPETAVPENIREGVNLAGLIGVFSGGGGGAIVKYGEFTTPASVRAGMRISVDIGFIPDILLVFVKTYPTGSYNSSAQCYFGCSDAFSAAFGAKGVNTLNYGNYGGVYTQSITETASGAIPITGADETGFNLGYVPPKASWTYIYVAIGGLA